MLKQQVLATLEITYYQPAEMTGEATQSSGFPSKGAEQSVHQERLALL